MIPGSVYDRTTTAADKRQMTGPMYGTPGSGNFRPHDPMSYIDTSSLPGASQPSNGGNLSMPHQMMIPSMPMPFMGGITPYNTMMNGMILKKKKKTDHK